jgi:hypothetical protein
LKGDIPIEIFGILLYLAPVFAVLALLNALFRIARALESIAESMKPVKKPDDA